MTFAALAATAAAVALRRCSRCAAGCPAGAAVGLLNTALPFTYCYALWHIQHRADLDPECERAAVRRPGGLGLAARDAEPLARARAAAGFGIVLLSWHKVSLGGEQTALSVLACLGATLCYGIAASCTRLYLSDVPPLSITAASMTGAALALAPATLWSWGRSRRRN